MQGLAGQEVRGRAVGDQDLSGEGSLPGLSSGGAGESPEPWPDSGVPINAARDLSYAHGAQSRAGQTMIRGMEFLLGRPALIRRARGYQEEIAEGGDFWSAIMGRFGLQLDFAGGSMESIPAEGPLILVANHPFGVLDGLVMGHLLQQRRSDFRILAHSVFSRAPDLARIILPVHFEESATALTGNLDTRRRARAFLSEGGAIGIFPGGTVSTGARLLSRPMDPSWRGFTARMIARSGATVIPVHFEGRNSALFQLASHLHATLRMGLLLREFHARADTPVCLSIGAPIPPAELGARAGNTKAMMDFLRRATYELSPKPLHSYEYGYEFEAKYRT